MRSLVVGNWKMNGLTHSAATIAGTLREAARSVAADLVVCPPFTQIISITHALVGAPIEVGGQDCHPVSAGPHTGDISAPMLRDAGATWVILGHSERRMDHGETDALVRAKARAAATAGLTPIVCVGETEVERQAGRAEPIVAAQLAASLPEDFAGVVAYEPVWAIGAGRTPSEADIVAMHAFIRGELVAHMSGRGVRVRILYGGSVKASNAASLLGLPEVGGALVGGASLVAEDFLAIARAAPVLPIAPGSA